MSDSILFFWRRPTPPLFLGGAEISQNALAIQLAQYGYNVTYIGSTEDPNYPTMQAEKKYIAALHENIDVENLSKSGNQLQYNYKGIRCISLPQKHLSAKLEDICKQRVYTDIISSQEKSAEIINVANHHGLRTTGWLHSSSETGFNAIKGQPNHLLSTSNYIANIAVQKFAAKSNVFYPPFLQSLPLDLSSDRKDGYITLINPIKQKGLDLFIELAMAMPEHKFLAVEGWYENKSFLERKPENVTYMPRQHDMSPVWNSTKILLVPSKIDEAFGRVVVEASNNSIPSIVSRTGGLVEALNGSGKALAYGETKSWIEEIKKYDNPDYYLQSQITAHESSLKFYRNSALEYVKIISGADPLKISIYPS